MKIERFEDIKAWQEAYAAIDTNYISEQEFKSVYEKAAKTKALINGFIAYLKEKRNKQQHCKTAAPFSMR